MVINSAVWHTDFDQVRSAVSGLTYLVKYSERVHLDEWVNNGRLRIRNAASFASDKSRDRQDWETIRSYMTIRHVRDDPRTQRIPAPPGMHLAGNEICVRTVSVETLHSCPDYWMFSMSKSLSLDMLQLFGGSCCVVIGQEPIWARFLSEVADQLRSMKFTVTRPDGTKLEHETLPLKVATMSDVSYLGPPDDLDPRSIDWSTWMKQVGDGDELDHIFKKPSWYVHQDEFKFAWTHFDAYDIGLHSQRWQLTVEDVHTGDRHKVIEALDEEDEHWTYGLRLPPVMVEVTPPPEVIKLTLD